METLLILTYVAICCFIFKVFKIPLTKWTVPTAILGGVFLIGSLIISMNYHHPFTDIARTVVFTTPIVPLVKGRVIEVPVEPNKELKKGDVLFRINPVPFQSEVDAQKAALAQAKQGVKVLEEEWKEAQAQVEGAKAVRDRTKGIYERYATANENARAKGTPPPYSLAEVKNRKDTYRADEANVKEAEANGRSARLQFEANIGGVNTKVAGIQSKLDDAEFDLEQTILRAPSDGLVTQVILRPGMIAVPLPLRPTLVFVHKEHYHLIASFVQNSMRRVQVGNEAEVIFPSIPGHVFTGKVGGIQPVLAQGEVQAGGKLIDFGDVSEGRVPVQIVLDKDLVALDLPAGISAQVAVYNDDGFFIRHVVIIRKILLRMAAWSNFVFGPIH